MALGNQQHPPPPCSPAHRAGTPEPPVTRPLPSDRTTHCPDHPGCTSRPPTGSLRPHWGGRHGTWDRMEMEL